MTEYVRAVDKPASLPYAEADKERTDPGQVSPAGHGTGK